MSKKRIAEIYWLDSVQGRETRPEDVRRIWPIRSVGWVVRNDTEGVLLAHSMNPDGTIDYIAIPRAFVLRVDWLKHKKEE